jgi:trehalose 6-phosphate phosphatase
MPRAQRALRSLAASDTVHVAFISGRTVVDLAERTRVGGASYRGDHGAERAEAMRGFRPASIHVEREEAAPAAVRLIAALVDAVSSAVPERWLVVEDKVGTVTFHFRAAPDVVAARQRVLRVVDELDHERTLHRSGSSSRAVELRPPGASTKGDALLRLISERRPSAVLMLGDDRNDALAFDELRAARTRGVKGLAIAVAGHPDVTVDVAPRADVLLAGPDEVGRFLSRLVKQLSSMS